VGVGVGGSVGVGGDSSAALVVQWNLFIVVTHGTMTSNWPRLWLYLPVSL